MGYGRELDGLKPKGGPNELTKLHALSTTGLKYVHAAKPKPGQSSSGGHMSDYEKTMQQLKKIEEERKEDERNKEKMKEEAAKKFEDWVILKDMKDQALMCLNAIERPKPINNNSSSGHNTSTQLRGPSGLSGGNSQVSAANKSGISSRAQNYYSEETEECALAVGRALKRVDRTLLAEWVEWLEGMFTFNQANILWDSFDPIACDIHSSAYSQVN